MRIACAWHFDGQDLETWCTPIGIARAFEDANHSVSYYGYDPTPSANCDLSQLRRDAHKYDLIFFFMAGPSDSFDRELMLLKKSTKTKIFMEFGDDIPSSNFFHVRKNFVDGIFTLDKRCDKSYKEQGLPSHWMPCWCDDLIFHKIECERKNICVTSCIGDRPLLKEFSKNYGDKFIHKQVWQHDNTTFYNSGLFTYQFARWNELTRRIFEAGGCGNAVLTNRICPDTGIYELFEEDVDIAYFSTAEEAYEKMDRLYNDQEYRTMLSTNLYNKVITFHLPKNRVEQIIDVFNQQTNISR